MLNNNRRSWNRTRHRTNDLAYRGFTLVEMLVAVALVMLMMLMFAQVFQMAGESIGKMRGLAENDQRARSLQSVIKADLDKRTFRWVYPFAANENPGAPQSNIGQRQGYFYISENNPYNSLDDVIQFTVMSTITTRNTDTTPYYGQALNLATPIATYPNQPDADDSQLNANNTGLSTVAEVAYFVRNGNLYRRQLLIREPLPIAGTNPQPTDETQTNQPGVNVFGPIVSAGPPQSPLFQYTGSFWNDFDYSAYYTGATSGATFLGQNSLDNSGPYSTAIAYPAYRFGFSPAGITGIVPGLPKEFTADSADTNTIYYIGRFVLQECSDPSFIYPQGLTTTTTPYVPTNPHQVLTYDTTNNLISDFESGPRRGEDLILANVHAFDIQVWDELGQSFVNIGDPNLSSGSYDYALANRYSTGLGTAPSPAYGPRITEVQTSPSYAINAVYDTWHPQIDLNTANDPATSPDVTTGQTNYDDPPYRPVLYKAASVTGNFSDTAAWAPGVPYTVGTLIFPTGPPGTSITPVPPYPANTPRKLPYGQPFVYRCVQAGTSAASASPAGPTDLLLEPTWPQIANVTVNDNTVVWQAIDNRKPLKAIRLQIRFLDASSQQLRQLTIIQSLVDGS